MPAVPLEPLTVEDYRMMPETGPRYQLIEGELFVAPAPNRFHQDISGNIYFLLREYLEEHAIGKRYEAQPPCPLGSEGVLVGRAGGQESLRLFFAG